MSVRTTVQDADDQTPAADLSAAVAPRQKPWRSLDELAGTPRFQEALASEFPQSASFFEAADDVTRRGFMKLMGASLALAGVAGAGAGCIKPQRKIVPYVRQPEHLIPGESLFYATALSRGGYGRGVVVEQHEGRPTKIEGNPDHPSSLGGTDAIMQAEILQMYDPDRSQAVVTKDSISDWTRFADYIGNRLAAEAKDGKGVCLLTGAITSPTAASQVALFLKTYPQARWQTYEPVGCENAKAGARQAFGGANVQPVYHFEKAKTIVSLDSNFLLDDAGSVAYARQFTAGRRVRYGQYAMNRLFVAESVPTITGTMADERVRVRPSEVEAIAYALAAKLGVAGVQTPTLTLSAPARAWVGYAAADLADAKSGALVVTGECMPPAVHAIAHAMNEKIGARGTTVTIVDQLEVEPGGQNAAGVNGLRQLAADLKSGAITTLILSGVNPVYDAPGDLDAATAINACPAVIHHSLYRDETSRFAHWHLPALHDLESWGDLRAHDGTVALQQPLISPLYEGKSLIELIAVMIGNIPPDRANWQNDKSGHQLVQEFWKSQRPANFDAAWESWLNKGVVDGTASNASKAALVGGLTISAPSLKSSSPELAIRTDPSLWDGRYANNGWLQEVPKPLTKITWDAVIAVSRNTAQTMGLWEPGAQPGNSLSTPVVELSVNGKTIRGPLWVQIGFPENVVGVSLGFGRTMAGNVGNGHGYNAYTLRTADQPWSSADVKLTATSDVYPVACTQNHAAMDDHGRDIIRAFPIADAADKIDEKEGERRKVSLSLYADYDYSHENKWGMSIDLNACMGCNACVVACQSENNIAVVGKDEVSIGREMQWLRVDAYYTGGEEHPEGPFFQPMMCQQCETAPCELVCPVEATAHDNEGLNNMVYNRCVGTRYCSNNCPYKVRHFNFLMYSDYDTEVLKMSRNPNVTVRGRGVMEKCTYCVQRISAARIAAKKQDRPIRDGDVVTACAQACPTQAIVFGNLNDSGAAVTKLSQGRERSAWKVLDEDLQTKPRTSYLPRYTNRSGSTA